VIQLAKSQFFCIFAIAASKNISRFTDDTISTILIIKSIKMPFGQSNQ